MDWARKISRFRDLDTPMTARIPPRDLSATPHSAVVGILAWGWVAGGLGLYLWQFSPLAEAILRSLSP